MVVDSIRSRAGSEVWNCFRDEVSLRVASRCLGANLCTTVDIDIDIEICITYIHSAEYSNSSSMSSPPPTAQYY